MIIIFFALFSDASVFFNHQRAPAWFFSFYIAQVLLQDAATIIIHNYCLFSQSSFQRARLALKRAAGKENSSALAWKWMESNWKTYNTNRKVDNWMIFNSRLVCFHQPLRFVPSDFFLGQTKKKLFQLFWVRSIWISGKGLLIKYTRRILAHVSCA